jgi:hypothetical protein
MAERRAKKAAAEAEQAELDRAREDSGEAE